MNVPSKIIKFTKYMLKIYVSPSGEKVGKVEWKSGLRTEELLSPKPKEGFGIGVNA